MIFQKKIGFGIFAVAVVAMLLVACSFVSEKDSVRFESFLEEETQTLSGKLFPFAVSVPTRATHRLENNGKLVGYLTSEVVNLSDFEGRLVEVEGVFRTEKSREIFWVTSILVQDLQTELTEGELEPENAEILSFPKRFKTKNFTFSYPDTWEYSASPDGKAYFFKKSDANRRIFLTFSLQDYSPEASRIQPNFVINKFSGIKEVKTDPSGKEREEITLFSNLENKKYIFSATYDIGDFESKKAVFEAISSFVEGEAQVLSALESDQKAIAELEAEKVKKEAEKKKEEVLKAEAAVGIEEVVEADIAPKILEKEVAKPQKEKNNFVPETVFSPEGFDDNADPRAFEYTNNYLNFATTIPYGFWYKSFGAVGGALAEIGISDHEIFQRYDSIFFLRVFSGDDVADEITETVKGDMLILRKKRDETSFFEISGPPKFRDFMRSILNSTRKI